MSLTKLLRFAYLSSLILLGFTFFSSGMGKLYAEHSFPGFIGPVWLAERLKAYQLGLYARFIGYSQLTIGFMLLTHRFRTLGAIMLVPMLSNILMITISLEWRGTPFIVGILLSLNLYLLWYDRHLLLHLINGRPPEKKPHKKMSLSGSLFWLFSYLLALVSVQLSYYSLVLAWSLTALALLMGVFSENLSSIFFDRNRAQINRTD
jgi:hypothetical protein